MDIQKNVEGILTPVNNIFNTYILPIISRYEFTMLLSWLIVINIILSIDDIPKPIMKLFRSNTYKILLIFLTFYTASKNVYTSIVYTGILFSLYFSLKYINFEGFDLIWPGIEVIPGCVNIKVADLISIFNNDVDNLKKAMFSSGVPLNITLSDENAPVIATYLVNFGHEINENCSSPK